MGEERRWVESGPADHGCRAGGPAPVVARQSQDCVRSYHQRFFAVHHQCGRYRRDTAECRGNGQRGVAELESCPVTTKTAAGIAPGRCFFQTVRPLRCPPSFQGLGYQSPMMSLLFVTLLLNTAQRPTAVYRISPKVDISVTIVASLALVLPYAYADRLIKPRCPCDPREVNAFDRPAIGNTSPTAKTLSDATVGAVFIVPLALDALEVGIGRPWRDDAVVFAHALVVNGAVVTAA